MKDFEKEIDLYNEFEKLRKVLSRDKISLIDLPIFDIIKIIKDIPSSKFFNDIVLEFIIKLSEAIYWKSCLLLNIPFEEPKEENIEEVKHSKEFNYFKALTLDRILFDKIFVPEHQKNSIDDLNFKDEFFNRGDINDLIKALLPILEREEMRIQFLENFSENSIDYYIEEIQEYMEDKSFFTFKEFLRERGNTFEKKEFLLKVVYYFLALLFLCFYNYCILVQNNEREDIMIFSRR